MIRSCTHEHVVHLVPSEGPLQWPVFLPVDVHSLAPVVVVVVAHVVHEFLQDGNGCRRYGIFSFRPRRQHQVRPAARCRGLLHAGTYHVAPFNALGAHAKLTSHAALQPLTCIWIGAADGCRDRVKGGSINLCVGAARTLEVLEKCTQVFKDELPRRRIGPVLGLHFKPELNPAVVVHQLALGSAGEQVGQRFLGLSRTAAGPEHVLYGLCQALAGDFLLRFAQLLAGRRDDQGLCVGNAGVLVTPAQALGFLHRVAGSVATFLFRTCAWGRLERGSGCGGSGWVANRHVALGSAGGCRLAPSTEQGGLRGPCHWRRAHTLGCCFRLRSGQPPHWRSVRLCVHGLGPRLQIWLQRPHSVRR